MASALCVVHVYFCVVYLYALSACGSLCLLSISQMTDYSCVHGCSIMHNVVNCPGGRRAPLTNALKAEGAGAGTGDAGKKCCGGGGVSCIGVGTGNMLCM